MTFPKFVLACLVAPLFSQTQQQIDYVTQIKNKPAIDSRSYSTLAAAVAAVTSPGGTVFVGASTSFSTTLSLALPITLTCKPGVTMTWTGGASVMISIASNGVTVSDCNIVGGSASNIITNSGTRTGILIDHNQMTGGVNAVNFTAGSQIDVTRNRISGFTNTGIGTQFNVTTTYVKAIGNYVSSASCTVTNCGAISFWGAHNSAIGNQVIIGGNQDGGIFIGNDGASGITDAVIADNTITAVGGNPFECSNIGSVTGFVYSNNVCRITGTLSGAFIGFEAGGSKNGSITGNNYDGGNFSTAQSGMLLQTMSYTTVIGNTIQRLGSHSDNHGIALLHTNFGYLTSQPMSGNIVSNNLVIDPLGMGSKIVIDTGCDSMDAICLASDIKNNVFSGNTIVGSGASGEVCLRASNNNALPSGQYSNVHISNNTIQGCYIGIGTYDVPNNLVDNNQILGSAASLMYDDISSGLTTNARVIDFNGIPFASLGGQYTIGHLDGSMIYCTDCTVANPCAGSGSGSMAKRLNNAWRCN